MSAERGGFPASPSRLEAKWFVTMHVGVQVLFSSFMAREPFIVFGYGSLIFKPPPHVVAQVPGFLKGYVRRFAQKSHDHRGTPEHPGRVVTLVHKEDWDLFSSEDAFPDEDIVWGIAYTIDPVFEDEVRAYLGEYLLLLGLRALTDGYTMETIPIYSIVNGEEKIIIPNAYSYVGRKDNPSFCAAQFVFLTMADHSVVGSEPLPALAHRIWISVGPSGQNKEYLYHLADAVRHLSPDSVDRHLFTLEEMVKKLDGSDTSPVDNIEALSQ
ncbi:Gamma-glutamylcyclotransferase [Mycena chlorophos]|uniref:glutathione-specific gamma-glutamylcyclotransferase n=1 Tax=Mycena chlorophos TaxID=658473 RepID=A0A8H6TKG8_MYCCL|nr:Gamma-glutamylcyclotransferase [Mycena chlorophos]